MSNLDAIISETLDTGQDSASIAYDRLPDRCHRDGASLLTLSATGTFDSSTVALQGSHDDSVWFNLATLTADGAATTNARCAYYQIAVTGGTASGLKCRLD